MIYCYVGRCLYRSFAVVDDFVDRISHIVNIFAVETHHCDSAISHHMHMMVVDQSQTLLLC